MDAKRIAQLLAHGAHALRAPEEEANKEGEAFAQEVLPTSPRSDPPASSVCSGPAQFTLLSCQCKWIR